MVVLVTSADIKEFKVTFGAEIRRKDFGEDLEVCFHFFHDANEGVLSNQIGFCALEHGP